MYTVRFQLELSESEKRFLSKSFRIMNGITSRKRTYKIDKF